MTMDNMNKTKKGKRFKRFWRSNLFLYLIFVAISFLFWMLMALNDVIHKDVVVALNVAGVPQEVTFINNIPDEINVSIKDKGASLLKYSFGKDPVIDIKFEDYAGESNFRISAATLQGLVRDEFGGTSSFTFQPDSVSATFTNMPGKVVPVKLDAIITTNYQYTQWDDVSVEPDSVTVYASSAVLATINEVETELFAAEGLRDSLYQLVRVKAIPNARVSPREVSVVVPVEQLIAKNQEISIITSNVPDGAKLITFPSKVKASYLVPQSKYKQIDDIWAEVDYNDIAKSEGNKLKINVSYIPEGYKQISLANDSVEFIIDRD